MQDLAGQSIDFGEWLQWYAFDTIGNITFSKTFGFIKDRADKNDILDGLEFGNRYNTFIGQVPGWHPWLIGNWTLVNNAMKIPAIARANPVVILNRVGSSGNSLLLKGKLIFARCSPRPSTAQRSPVSTRPKLIILPSYAVSWLRIQVDSLTERYGLHYWSTCEWSTHTLSRNIDGFPRFAGSDTTAMSLRAVFYFLVQNPEAYCKLRAEINEAESAGRFGELVDFETGSNLPYL